MTGVTALEKTLIGVDSPNGTGNVTTHWRGTGKIRDRRERVFPPERVGKIGGTTRSYVTRTGGEVMLEGDATFQNLCYLYNAGIYNTTPTTDASSARIWTWNVQTSSSDPLSSTDLVTLAIESGDNEAVEKVNYAFVREYTESGKQGEGLQISATLQSRSPSTAAAFTAVGDTDFNNPAQTILCSKVALSIDASSDAAGTTAKTETYLEHTLRHTTGWVALPARDGRLDFSNIKHIDDEMMLDVVFEHNSIAVAEKEAWKNGTERVIQLKFTGDALTSTDAGATYDTYTYIRNFYGTWQTFGAEGLEEMDGDNIYRGTFRVAKATNGGAFKATIIVVNETATLP